MFAIPDNDTTIIVPPEKTKKNAGVKMVLPTCNVCTETLNKSNRIDVKCGFCDYVACKECYKHYLLDSNLNAHCMNCKREWDLKTMVSKFDRKFLDTNYKQHRGNILVEREKGLMVATQPLVEIQILRDKTNAEIKKLRSAEKKIRYEIIELMHSLGAEGGKLERKKFIRKCTKDNCRGFLSTQWKCGLCDFWTCPECHDLIGINKNVEHVCDNDTLATAKLLDSDTKSCPKCSVGIFRIEGCDQMFCTECHTAFSWKSGQIELGQIHNPHYFQFQRAGGHIPRNPLEVRCGREIDNSFIRKLENIILGYPIINKAKIIESARCILHLRRVEIPRFATNHLAENEDLRIEYLCNNIDEDAMKRSLQLREKKNEKKHELYNIITMFISCQTETFYRLYDAFAKTTKTKDEFDISNTNIIQILEESKQLLSYTNNCLTCISTLYKCNLIQLSETFRIINSKSKK